MLLKFIVDIGNEIGKKLVTVRDKTVDMAYEFIK